MEKIELYFENESLWREWLLENHRQKEGVYLIFYKVGHEIKSMRWEEAVKVAVCFGWIDSTVKSLGEGKRRQYFSPRNPKSAWSKLNKTYVAQLTEEGLMHKSGLEKIEEAKKSGAWTALDDVEKGTIPDDLKAAFEGESDAFLNYQNFSRSYRKNYLAWLNQAKRRATREKRIEEIIRLCRLNIKTR